MNTKTHESLTVLKELKEDMKLLEEDVTLLDDYMLKNYMMKNYPE